MATPAALELVDASPSATATTLAVDAINLKIPAGTYCCLLGPSGCGKTIDAAHDRRPRDRRPTATSSSAPQNVTRPAAGRARHGDDVPELRAVPASQPRSTTSPLP